MRTYFLVATILLAGPAVAEQMDHGDHAMHHSDSTTKAQTPAPMAQETGQATFAAIQEIVALLEADPQTDWAKVNIDALRAHLVDMDNVTMHAKVKAQAVKGGTAFIVSSDDPEIAGSIKRMVTAHAAMMNGQGGMQMRASDRPYGAMLTAVGPEEKINGLGFFGLMAAGMHHQPHHMAIARGGNPHQH